MGLNISWRAAPQHESDEAGANAPHPTTPHPKRAAQAPLFTLYVRDFSA